MHAAVAADLTQDAFYKAYKTRASFRGDSPARSWLLRIVVNGAISVRRRPRVGILDLTSEPEDTGLGHAERLELSMAMECLSNRQRAALVLRYYHGFDYAAMTIDGNDPDRSRACHVAKASAGEAARRILKDGAQTPWRGGKAQLHEGGIRVPLIIRWPAAIAPGSRPRSVETLW